MATLIAAAMHRTASWTGMPGMKKAIILPNAAPVLNNGNMKPPR
jgi:hypothetical protein